MGVIMEVKLKLMKVLMKEIIIGIKIMFSGVLLDSYFFKRVVSRVVFMVEMGCFVEKMVLLMISG